MGYIKPLPLNKVFFIIISRHGFLIGELFHFDKVYCDFRRLFLWLIISKFSPSEQLNFIGCVVQFKW